MAKAVETVDELMARRGHPFAAEINALRDIIRKASPAIAEHVKWNGPSYYLVANPKYDLGNIVMARDKFVLLVMVFYNGTMLESPLLSGDYKDRRLLQLDDMAAIKKNAGTVTKIIKDWVKLHS